jgi:hypothetical protein
MTYVVIALIVAAIANLILRERPGSQAATALFSGGTIACIRGNDRFEVEVVGKGHEYFETLAKRHKRDQNEGESFSDAVLALEEINPHDPQAVAVSLEGLPVGHLSRSRARDFRRTVARAGLQQHRRFAVAARLYWGGDDGPFSVTLDLPQA